MSGRRRRVRVETVKVTGSTDISVCSGASQKHFWIMADDTYTINELRYRKGRCKFCGELKAFVELIFTDDFNPTQTEWGSSEGLDLEDF